MADTNEEHNAELREKVSYEDLVEEQSQIE